MVKQRFFVIFLSMLWLFGACAFGQSSLTNALSQFALEKKLPVSRTFQQHLQTGIEKLNNGTYQQASEQFILACLASPQHPLPHFYLSLSLFAHKEYSIAGKILRQTVNLYPYWESVDISISKLFPPQFELIRKLADFENWLFRSSRDSDSYFLFAFLCQFSNLPNKAQGAYQILFKKDPSYLEARIFFSGKTKGFLPPWDKIRHKALQALENKEYARAIESWASAFLYYPNHPEALYPLVLALSGETKYNQGATVLEKALEIAPSLYSSPYNSIDTLGKEEFFRVLGKAEAQLQNRPDDPSLLFLLTHLYILAQDKQKAQVSLQHLRGLQSQQPFLGFLSSQLKKISSQAPPKQPQPEQEQPLAQQPEKKPQEPQQPKQKITSPAKQRGLAAFKQQNYQQALQAFAEAIVEHPEDIESRWLLAMANFAQGDYDSTFNILKELFPQVPGQKKLPWIEKYSNPKIFFQQLQQLNKRVIQNPSDDKALFLLGYLLYVADKPRQAKGVFDRLRQRRPNDPEVVFFHRLLQRSQ